MPSEDFNIGPKRYIAREPYSYEKTFDTLGPGASSSLNIQIQSDSDFVWSKGTYQADIAGAAQTESSRVIPLVNLQIIDSGSGRNMFDAPIRLTTLFGTGELPFVLSVPRLFVANSTITLQMSNFSVATTYTTQVVLYGFKAYQAGGYQTPGV